jgi:Tol biopolymer transport system component
MRFSRWVLSSLPAVVVAGGLVAGMPAARAGAFPGLDGKIVFENSGGAIYTVNPDGSGVHQVGASEGENPAWSPDGSKIVFATTRDNNYEVYVMNADGSGQTNLTNNPNGDWQPTWSPDGSKVAFVRNNGVGIVVMNADGSDQTPLSLGGDAPAWSPDGTKIAFTGGAPSEIYVANAADGSGVTQLTNNSDFDEFPSWSPDGAKIAFVSNRDGGHFEIYAMNSDGSDQTRLTDNGVGDFFPAWSPDGARIVFQRSTVEGSFDGEIFVMNADGSGAIQITDLPNGSGWADWQAVRLTIAASKSKVNYKRNVTITAHLLFPGSPNKTVSIYKIPYGGAKTLVLTGQVNGQGNLSATVLMTKRTAFLAEWSGDAQYQGGGVSNSITVFVFPVVKGALSGYYGTAGNYKLYHYRASCTNSGIGCPTYTVTVTPNHRGRSVRFTLQLFRGGAWRTVLIFSERLNTKSRRTVIFVYGSPKVKGIPTRVRAQFLGDADHLRAYSSWSYFKVTN